MAAAAVASRLRNVSRSTLRSNNADSFLLCNALHAINFSASSNNNDDESGGTSSFDDHKQSLKAVQPDSKSRTNFDDVRATLRNLNHQGKPSPSGAYDSFFGSTSKAASLEEIRKNLSEFRRKSASPVGQNPDAGKSSSGGPPFQSMYKSNVSEGNDGKDRLSFESIRDSLRQFRSSSPEKSKANNNESLASFSLKAFGQSLRLQPDGRGEERGQSSDSPPSPLFGRDMREKGAGESQIPKTEFMKMYSYDELGQKLRKLRPEAQQGEEQENKRFSLTELNERLQKLREMEEKESESNIGGLSFKDLRESLFHLRKSTENNKVSSWQRSPILGQIGQTIPNYMISPPKDDLVERYFHPDNMSAEEKMKIELKKAREEFKKHEADCGSSSVQVAQLTEKIKYLGKALHKKDKHSRKGLQEMIQKRKKLLKYLRRTDWDSYCFVISKLGLRDNPDYKT